MKKLKHFFIFLIFLGCLFFLFAPEVSPENSQFQELLEKAENSDIIIVFNSGGWGNTPFEKSEDFAPIVRGIQKTFDEWGYNSIVIPYVRTKDGFLGKITGTKDILNYFQESSENLADKIDFLAKNLPDKKIVIAGLSMGAAFVDETMKKLDKTENSVLAIEVGPPFWQKELNSENILRLDNEKKDSLSGGEIKTLLLSLFKASPNWFLAKISGENLSFGQALKVPGHKYSWDSSEVGPDIITFLEKKLR